MLVYGVTSHSRVVFFKQKTAYEVRISDWSADVCSSDLALAYLRLVHQSADDLAFERIVNTPKRGLGDKALARIHQLARAEGVPLSIAAARILDTDELTPQARRSLGNFVADVARWRDITNSSPSLLGERSEEHTPELQSLQRTSFAVFFCKKQT